jgi:hypothetical protein
VETCKAVDTHELPREAALREKRAAQRVALETQQESQILDEGGTSQAPVVSQPSRGRRKKQFNLSTPKYHALGHYAWAIRRYGTTDSYTSEIVSHLRGLPNIIPH